MKKYRLYLIISALLITMCLVGCGGDESSNSETASSTQQTSTVKKQGTESGVVDLPIGDETSASTEQQTVSNAKPSESTPQQSTVENKPSSGVVQESSTAKDNGIKIDDNGYIELPRIPIN